LGDILFYEIQGAQVAQVRGQGAQVSVSFISHEKNCTWLQGALEAQVVHKKLLSLLFCEFEGGQVRVKVAKWSKLQDFEKHI